MKLSLSVCASDLAQEKAWEGKLSFALGALKSVIKSDLTIHCSHQGGALGRIVLVDAFVPDLAALIQKMDRKGRAILLIVGETSTVPELWSSEKVDDVLVTPFRPLEVFSKLLHCDQILKWRELGDLNVSFSAILERLKQDLKLTEQLQKMKAPNRFPNVRGFKVASRYFAGMRSGGDYFDLIETEDKNHLSLVLTHSTSYGLSTAVLTALMRVAMKVSLARMGTDGVTADSVRSIHEELALTLNEKDRLSLFYGNIDRKQKLLRFLNLGEALIYYADPGEEFKKLHRQGKAISQERPIFDAEEKIQLQTGGRLILLSYGFVEVLGGDSQIRGLLERFQKDEPSQLMNEFSFRLKSSFKPDEEMPAQDCTAMILDVDGQVIQLTPH